MEEREMYTQLKNIRRFMEIIFKQTHYKIIKQVIPKNLANFIYRYFSLKREVARLMLDSNYISPFTPDWGIWHDDQVPNTYSHYSDAVFETLLIDLQERIEKESGYKLYPTYSYARIYKQGDVLHRHKDRDGCEISATMHIGGDAKWPIYLDATGSKNKAGVAINLAPGDLLIYKGCEYEHWREGFSGKNYCQAFFHYADVTHKTALQRKFDERPFLGLPAWFRKMKVKRYEI